VLTPDVLYQIKIILRVLIEREHFKRADRERERRELIERERRELIERELNNKYFHLVECSWVKPDLILSTWVTSDGCSADTLNIGGLSPISQFNLLSHNIKIDICTA